MIYEEGYSLKSSRECADQETHIFRVLNTLKTAKSAVTGRRNNFNLKISFSSRTANISPGVQMAKNDVNPSKGLTWIILL